MVVDVWLVAAVVKEQVCQENEQKPVKQTQFQNKHLYFMCTELFHQGSGIRGKVTAARSQRRTNGL